MYFKSLKNLPLNVRCIVFADFEKKKKINEEAKDSCSLSQSHPFHCHHRTQARSPASVDFSRNISEPQGQGVLSLSNCPNSGNS